MYEILIPSVNLNAGTANIRRVANSQASAINDGTTCIGIDFIPPPPTTTTTPDPTEPDPITPEPFAPDPTEPDPTPDPTEPDPTEPVPALDPTAPVPAPDPTEPDPLPQPSQPDPVPDPTEPDPTPEPFAPDPTEPDPAPDPTGPDPTELVEEGETPTSTTTTLDVDEEVTSQALSKVETGEPEDDESSFPTVGLAAILAGLAAAAGLALTSAGQLIRKRITGFLAGSILAFLIFGRKRNRCEHCNKLVTSKEGVLVDEDDKYECADNPDGDHHQLEEKQAQKNA